MKNKKWLLIIFILMVIINSIYFYLNNFVKIEHVIAKRVGKYLENLLNAKVDINEIKFNDKEINISRVEIKEKNTVFTIKQIYIEYDMFKLVSSGFQLGNNIKYIRIIEPSLVYNYHKNEKKNKEAKSVLDYLKIQLPELSNYFNSMEVYEGEIIFSYKDDSVNLSEILSNINININNSNDSTSVFLTAQSDTNQSVTITGNIKNKHLEKAQIIFDSYKPNSLKILKLGAPNFTLNGYVNYNDNLSYHLSIDDFYSKIDNKYPLKFASLVIDGDTLTTNLSSQELTVDEQPVLIKGQLYNIFTKDPEINISFSGENLSVDRYMNSFKGNFNVLGKLYGTVSKTKLTTEITSENIFYGNQSISDLRLSGILADNDINFNIHNAIWLENIITGSGSFNFREGFQASLFADNFEYNVAGINIKGKLLSLIKIQAKETNISVDFSDVFVQNNLIFLDNVMAKGYLKNDLIEIFITRDENDFEISGKSSLQSKETDLDIAIKRMNLNKVLKNIDDINFQLPAISGNILLNHNPNNSLVNSRIRIYDSRYGRFDGIIKSKFVFDYLHNKSYLRVKTHGGKFNYEDFEFFLLANGTLSEINTQYCVFNNEIFADIGLDLTDNFNYKFNLHADEINLNRYLEYFINHDSAKHFSAKTSFNINFDTTLNNKLLGYFNIDRFRYKNYKYFSSEMKFSGNNSQLNEMSLDIFHEQEKLVDINGSCNWNNDFQYSFIGKIRNFQIEKILFEYNISGVLSADFSVDNRNKTNLFLAEINCDDIAINNLNINNFSCDLLQEDSTLTINKFTAFSDKLFNFSTSGSIGYNIFTGKTFPGNDKLEVNMSGDILNLASNQLPFLDYGTSNSFLNLDLNIREEGISVPKGSFKLSNGSIQIKNQQEIIHDILVDIDIKENIATVNTMTLNVGEEKIYIHNDHRVEADNFYLGSINLGKFFLKTGENGILINIPDYSPKNSVVNAVVKGRYSDYAEVSGPFDNIKIIADIYGSNGNGIYPPRTKNLVTLLAGINDFSDFENWLTESDKKDKNYTDKENLYFDEDDNQTLPITIDLKLNFTKNMRYVTYPTNFLVEPESFLWLYHKDGIWEVKGANFTSHQGNLEIFGASFEVEEISLNINQYQTRPLLLGTFTKKISDGTIITLSVFGSEENEEGSWGNLQIDLSSDNSEDRTLSHILAKLKYNRSLDDLSDYEQRSILQDEAIQLAGLGISTTFIDPIISPIESLIRKSFKLDMFYINPGFIENLFSEYSRGNSLDDSKKSTPLSEFGSGILLDNLSIKMGKYIASDLLVDYEIFFETSTDLSNKTEVNTYHDIGATYLLPYKFKLSYKYLIKPDFDTNSHEIFLERSFRF